MGKWFKSGTPWIWMTGGAVSLSLIAVIGYAICLIPDMYYNIIVYLYEGEYLIRILVLPPPIILGLIDLYLFKPRKKMLS